MELGFSLPHIGPAASAKAIETIARRAEELGYHHVAATERVLLPLEPQTPYPATPDGSWPDVYNNVYSPLLALTWAAAKTSRIRLMTSILVASYRKPLMLAKELADLDQLSDGRVVVGLGAGFSKDEHDALGVPMDRAKRIDEVLEVLKTVWGPDPVEFNGTYYQIPRSNVGPKPVQQPGPPIYLAAYTPAAMKRVATVDGWNPAVFPPAAVVESMEMIRETARQAGRDPSALKVVYRAILNVTDEPLPREGRPIFFGSPRQVQEDIAALRDTGVVNEITFDPTFSPAGQSLEGWVESLEMMKQLADTA
ncbi:LLM class F420-dependent oxidoreductase [Streptomyces sp. NPDC004647]|uniref:LLM class F420-dependent oxidoreductase n=1 Tax=Streptomyces sp. NPDC004647 TaxID=3154671 RepID=UPI0033A3C846